MRFNRVPVSKQAIDKKNHVKIKPKRRIWWRQFALGLTVSTIAACSPFGEDDKNAIPRGTVGFVKGFIGGVAADEPRAVLIGRDVLAAGGSAADAAVAVYFAMSVTRPSSASLGGGGVCLVRDQKTEKVETLDFRALASRRRIADGKFSVAIPGNPLGFFALHAKYGRLKWAELIRPSENLARFGNQISRALGQDFILAGQKLLSDPEGRRLFGREDGQALHREGDFLKQTELSGTLARIRAHGGGQLYSGPFAREFVNAVNAVGGDLDYEELRKFRPQWRPTITVGFIKGSALHFPSPPGGAGVMAAQMASMLTYGNLFEDEDDGQRAHLMAEVIERSLADRANWRGKSVALDQLASLGRAERLLDTYKRDRRVVSPGAASAGLDPTSQSSGSSFSVMDFEGSAVACSLSMNKPFGIGRIPRGTGVIIAPEANDNSDSFATMMLVNTLRNTMYYVSSASGGALASTAMMNVAAYGLVDDEGTLESAMNRKRVHHGGADGITYMETGIRKNVVSGLSKRGHKTAFVNSMGIVNAVLCVNGIPHDNIDCSARTDPRGFGMATSTE